MADIELLIKIPEEVKNRLCFGVTYQKDIQTVCEALSNGTSIPDNATNGDVIKTIFPNMKIEKHHSFARFIDGEEYIPCPYNWLNAPYQKGGRDANSD